MVFSSLFGTDSVLLGGCYHFGFLYDLILTMENWIFIRWAFIGFFSQPARWITTSCRVFP